MFRRLGARDLSTYAESRSHRTVEHDAPRAAGAMMAMRDYGNRMERKYIQIIMTLLICRIGKYSSIAVERRMLAQCSYVGNSSRP
jgi:hypothetical protein